MSLGLSQTPILGSWDPKPSHKSAGLAFVLSLLIPGCGQFYCDKVSRGLTTLGFFVLGITLCFVPAEETRGVGIFTAFTLWVFAFLDAYFTALEINSGADQQTDTVNPRVAVVLNLLTAGLGYFYLGERTKGMVLFVLVNAVKWLMKATTGFWAGVSSLFAITMALVMAVDGYRLAREQIQQNRAPEPIDSGASPGKPSRLPVFIPVGLAAVAVISLLGMSILGLAMKASFDPRALHARSGYPTSASASRRFAPGSPQARQAAVVDNFLSVIEDVKRIQRKNDRTWEELAQLERDRSSISAALASGGLDTSDLKVAYYYRGETALLMNSIRKREGEDLDLSASQLALDDFNHVISSGGNTYDPAVSVTNAQYWSGAIARNDLHSEDIGYSFWEKCAQKGHPGCMNIMATARITGKGGQKIDLRQALEMHTAVYNTGNRAACSGAYSARTIARIAYFTGVRRPGDDELGWLEKSYTLMDKLETSLNNRSVCHRAGAQVEEFLYRLSRGDRRDQLLQQATERLDESSIATRALIQYLLGATDKTQFEALVESDHFEDHRCTAYFDAMWYAESRKKLSDAQDFHHHLSDIGDYYCATELAFANKFKW